MLPAPKSPQTPDETTGVGHPHPNAPSPDSGPNGPCLGKSVDRVDRVDPPQSVVTRFATNGARASLYTRGSWPYYERSKGIATSLRPPVVAPQVFRPEHGTQPPKVRRYDWRPNG